MSARRLAYPRAGAGRAAPLQDRPPLVLRGYWRWVGCVVWATYALVALALAIAHLPTDYTGAVTFPGIGAPQSAILRQGLQQLGVNPALYAIYRTVLDQSAALVSLIVAALLMRRKSSEAVVVLIAVFLVAGIYASDPPSLIALAATHPLQAALGKALTITRMTLLVALFFVFPDGRVVPRWGLAPLSVWFLQLVGIMFFPGSVIDSWDWPPLPTALGFAAIFGPAVYAQLARYRHVSGPIERQQTKWAIGGLLIAITSFAALNVWLAAQQNRWSDTAPVRAVIADVTFNTILTLAFAAVPLTLAVAIFRYRLFAIDIVLNRALVYGGLTASVIGVYTIVVGVIGALLRTGTTAPISLVATGAVAVLFQPLRARLQRGANRLLYGERDEPYAVISRLGRQLEGTLAPDTVLPTIVETVAGALKLPYAAIALGDGGAPAVAATGTPAPGLLSLPLAYQGVLVGELRLAPRAPGEPFSPGDRRLLDDLARQAGAAVHAVQLTQALQQARERLVSAREEERRRLRRDLHDGLGPRLAALTLRLDTARLLLADNHRAAEELGDAAARAEEAVSDIRRLVYALRPPALDDLGLVGALRQVADGYGPGGPDITVAVCEVDGATLRRLPAAVEVAAYRIALEALTNVVRHAQARHCAIRIGRDAERRALVVEVMDDGRGIAPDCAAGIGLRSMRERAEELGGACSIEALPGHGTLVAVRLPCRNVNEDEPGGAA